MVATTLEVCLRDSKQLPPDIRRPAHLGHQPAKLREGFPLGLDVSGFQLVNQICLEKEWSNIEHIKRVANKETEELLKKVYVAAQLLSTRNENR